jgi:hypothetical protein
LEPNKTCKACSGTGKYYIEQLEIYRKCICTLLTEKEIQEVISSKREVLTKRNLVLKEEVSASALLFIYLLNKGACTEEDKALQQANLYGESLGYLMGRRKKIRTDDSGMIPVVVSTPAVPLVPIPDHAAIGTPEIHYEDIVKRPYEVKSKTEGSKVEIHYNIGCINCQSLHREMPKIGPLIFCTECFKEVFKTKNPLIEEKSVVRAWLSYNQDILLGQHPIKPGL